MRRRHALVAATLLVGLTLCTILLAAAGPAAATTTHHDFYRSAPTGWWRDDVGTLLKYQRVYHTWPCLSGLTAYRVMYVSRGATDGFSHGGKVFETGMVYIPSGKTAPAGGWPILAWGHGTSGVGDSAAPSKYRWLYPEPLAWAWDEYAVFVGQVGHLGAIVTCPDYEGMGTPGLHTYLNINSEARSMIDAVRAARHLAARLDVAASRNWAAAGHSQGGGAAIGAAQLASTYGYGLHLKATVAFAPAGAQWTPSFMEAKLADPDWYPYLGYMAWGMKAIDTHHQFNFKNLLGPWILPYATQAPNLYFDYWWLTLLQAHWSGAYPNGSPMTPTVADVFAKGWQNNPVVKRFFADWVVGGRHASGPILVVQGTADLLFQSLPSLKAELSAVHDRYKVVLLAGRDHDAAVPGGWPSARVFLRVNFLTK